MKAKKIKPLLTGHCLRSNANACLQRCKRYLCSLLAGHNEDAFLKGFFLYKFHFPASSCLASPFTFPRLGLALSMDKVSEFISSLILVPN